MKNIGYYARKGLSEIYTPDNPLNMPKYFTLMLGVRTGVEAIASYLENDNSGKLEFKVSGAIVCGATALIMHGVQSVQKYLIEFGATKNL